MTSSRAQDAATRGALIVTAGELGTLVVTGRDRKTWLNGLITSDLAKLGAGRASYGLALQKIGRIVADLWVVDAGDRLLVGVRRDRVALLTEHFDKYLMMEDATVVDGSVEYAWAFLHGPRAEGLAAELSGVGAFAGTFDATGLGGAVVVASAERLTALLDELAGPEVVVGDDRDWEALRIARSVPRFGVDFSDKNYPQEAALEKVAVSFNKGCYLGQEVVCRLEMRGHVTKKLVPVRIWAAPPPGVGAEVRTPEGRVLGAVSSVMASENGQESAGLAMIRYDFAEPGTALEIGGAKAEVVARPAGP